MCCHTCVQLCAIHCQYNALSWGYSFVYCRASCKPKNAHVLRVYCVTSMSIVHSKHGCLLIKLQDTIVGILQNPTTQIRHCLDITDLCQFKWHGYQLTVTYLTYCAVMYWMRKLIITNSLAYYTFHSMPSAPSKYFIRTKVL